MHVSLRILYLHELAKSAPAAALRRRRAWQARRSSTKHLEMTAAKIAGPALPKLLVAIAIAVMAYLVSSSAPIMWELDGPALANQLQRSDLKCARPTEATHIRRLRRDTAPLHRTAARTHRTAARTRTALPPTAASTRGACRHHTAEAPLFFSHAGPLAAKPTRRSGGPSASAPMATVLHAALRLKWKPYSRRSRT